MTERGDNLKHCSPARGNSCRPRGCSWRSCQQRTVTHPVRGRPGSAAGRSRVLTRCSCACFGSCCHQRALISRFAPLVHMEITACNVTPERRHLYDKCWWLLGCICVERVTSVDNVGTERAGGGCAAACRQHSSGHRLLQGRAAGAASGASTQPRQRWQQRRQPGAVSARGAALHRCISRAAGCRHLAGGHHAGPG